MNILIKQNPMLDAIRSFLPGNKVIILGVLAIVYGIAGWATGHLDQQQALDAVWAGLTSLGFRAAIR